MTAAAAAAALNAVPVSCRDRNGAPCDICLHVAAHTSPGYGSQMPGNLDTLIAGAQPLGLSVSGRPPLPPGNLQPAGPSSVAPPAAMRGAATPSTPHKPIHKPLAVVKQVCLRFCRVICAALLPSSGLL